MPDDQKMPIVVQWVRTTWTKQSRGGPEATRRNAAPIAFPLPEEPPPFVHEVLMHEHDEFQPRTTTRPWLPGKTSDTGVLLRETDGLLRVELTPARFGMPLRRRRPPAIHLAPGQWVRWQINYRFSGFSSGDWTYRLDTLNLLNGPLPRTDQFLAEPTHDINELGSLR